MDENGLNEFSIVTVAHSYIVKDRRSYAQMVNALISDGQLATHPVGGAKGITATFFKAHVIAILGKA